MDRKVLVLIVTYNRAEYLRKLLEKLKLQTQQVYGILIVDNNSTDNTSKMLEEMTIIKKNSFNNLHENEVDNIKYYYYRNSENLGGSGGFYTAFNLAKNLPIDYCWIMDDDVFPENDCLENLLSFINEEVKICIPNRSDDRFTDKAIVDLNLRNPLKIKSKKKTYVEITNQEYIPVVDMPFEGPLIKKEIIEKVGLPNKEYFILYDDTDYALRCIKYTKIYMIPSAILHKQIIPSKDKKRLMDSKNYYDIRNSIVFDRKYGENILVRNLRPIILWLDLTIRALVLRKYSNFKIINKAYKDGVRGNMGKESI